MAGKVKRKVGLFGGTFNPIHLGHLRAAEEIREEFGLKRIIFIPAGIPPHRPLEEVVSFADRYEMVKLAIASNPSFEVSDIEGRQKRLSYTVETLKYFSQQNQDDEYYFIVGLDAFIEIHTWKSPQELLRLAHFIVMPRKGLKKEEILKPLKMVFSQSVFLRKDICQLPTKKNVYFCDISSLNISATFIRQLLSQGKSIRYLVPEAVADYIYQKGLYRRKDG